MGMLDNRLEPTKPDKDIEGIKFWKEFPLSEDEQKEIAGYYHDIYKRCSNSGMRNRWIEKARKMREVYDQKREKVNCFIGDWTFMHVPAPTMIVDKVKDNIFNAINSERLVNIQGVDIIDKKYDEQASRFFNYILLQKSGFKKATDSANLDALITGVGFVETPWVEKKTSRFTKTETGLYELRDYIEQYPEVRYLAPEDVLLTPDARFNGVEDCSAVFIQREELYSDMQEMVKDGVYTNIDKSSIASTSEIKSGILDKVLEETESEREGVDDDITSDVGHETVPIIEVWTKFRYKKNRLTEWRFWITPTNKKLIRWHVSTTVVRPLVRYSIEPIQRSIYSRGLMEKMDNISIELDTIMNQILQVQAYSILPPMFVDENADFDAKKFVWEAANVITMRDPNQNIRFANMPNAVPESMALFNQLFQLMQSLTSISDYLLGGGGNETATGVNALTRSAIAILQATMGRLALGYERVFRNVCIMTQQFADEEFYMKIDPQNGQALYEKLAIPVEQISGQWDFRFVPELVQSHEVKRNEYNQFFQMTFPIISQYPEGAMPDSVYYMTKKLFEVNGFDGMTEEVLGPMRGCDIGNMQGFSPSAAVLVMINGQYPKPKIDEDHEAYIRACEDFMITPAYADMPEKNKGLFTRQINERQQLMQNTAMIGQAGQVGGGMQMPNITSPSATNAVPMPQQQFNANMENVNARLGEGNAKRLGANRGQ